MRALQARARVSDRSAPGIGPRGRAAQPSDFANLMKNSVDHSRHHAKPSDRAGEAYEAGDKSVDLTKVMLEVQKAGLAFAP
jgi:flagellar hook-basal body complex protein FliE